jgi:hypothetical protein
VRCLADRTPASHFPYSLAAERKVYPLSPGVAHHQDTHTSSSIHAFCTPAAPFCAYRAICCAGLFVLHRLTWCLPCTEFSASRGTSGTGTGRDTALALSILLLATSAVCSVCGDDPTRRPPVIALVIACMLRRSASVLSFHSFTRAMPHHCGPWPVTHLHLPASTGHQQVQAAVAVVAHPGQDLLCTRTSTHCAPATLAAFFTVTRGEASSAAPIDSPLCSGDL